MSVDGLDPDDPGVRMLAASVAPADPATVLLVCCGSLPGLSTPRRLILDVKELDQATEPCTPASIGTVPSMAGVRHAAVWPRAHLGKDFATWCLAFAAVVLEPGGLLWCAVRKQKGADSLRHTIEELYGNVEVVGRDRGYRLFRARRDEATDHALARRLLELRHHVTDPAIEGVTFETVPGVFSRRELDAGTRALIEHVQAQMSAVPDRILDLGSGWGPLAIWAARRWPSSRVYAVDSNVLATALTRRNAEHAHVADRVDVRTAAAIDPQEGPFDLALVNPPTHAAEDELRRLIAPLREVMAPGGVAFLVANRAGRTLAALHAAAASTTVHVRGGFSVIEAHWERQGR